MENIVTLPSTINIPDNVNVNVRRELIDELGRFAVSNRDTLCDVHATFEHMENGLDLIYGLDFDIIYSYAMPWSRDAHHAKMVQRIIENDRTQLTLLPGTVQELFHFLKHVKRQQIEVEALRRSLQEGTASDQTVECALNLCKTGELGNLSFSQDVDKTTLATSLIQATTLYDSAIKRILRILESKKVIELASVFQDPDVNVYEEGVYDYFFVKLAVTRKGQKHKTANMADAMNIATVVNHAQIENEKWIADPENYNGQVLRLLTNTRCLLEMPIETYNHEVIASIGKSPKTTLKGIGHSLAVRSVYEAGFATCMLECCQDDVTGCRRMSGKQLEKARLFEIAVEKIDEYERDYGKTRQPDISDTRRIINNILPNYAQDFIKDRWYNTVKRLSVADAQELESKQCLTKTQDSWWVDPEGLMPTVFEANLEEYSRSDLTKLDYSYTSNEPSGILAILGISEREIEMPGESPPKRWCVQNVYQTPAKEILTLDKFDETFYATWPCGISETKTIILINKLFGLHGIIRDYKGVIELVYSEGEFIVELCSLPLKKPLSLSEYRRLLCKSREENKDLPGDKQVPSEILCDTTTCSLKIELLILGEDAGIMFAFKSPELIGPLMEAFIHTSSWAHGWEFASTLVDIVREGIEAKTVEWR